MYESEGQSEGLPKSSFPIYVAEGDVLFKQGEYEKAVESYTTALEIEPNDKNCLVARSKCHLKLGDAKAALKDAEAALEDDGEFNKGLYQKAEALYQSGDFEMSLVFYHRGNKLRPELQEFRLGIQKAQEAIDNSIGGKLYANVKLDNKGDLSEFYKQDESKTKKQPRMGYSKPSSKPQEDHKKRKQRKEQSDKEKEISKQLLGELYADKMYLDKLLKDQDLTRSDTDSGNRIYDLVSEGIDYLDTRTEFWRQQKPMYARKREKSDVNRQAGKDNKRPVDPTRYILKNLEEIDAAMADGRAKKALKQAQKVLKMVEGWDEGDVPDKQELIANLHSCIGNAYLDLNKMPDALHHHQKDLELSKKKRQIESLGQLGKSLRSNREVRRCSGALDAETALIKTPLEATWLYHEIGRCHLELGHYQEARDFGEKSFKAAQEAGDDMWQLNASVLIAQSEVKLGDLQEAIESFERSLEMAKVQGDEPAQSAISKALEELNERIVQGLKEREKKDGDEKEDEKDKDGDGEKEKETEEEKGKKEKKEKEDNIYVAACSSYTDMSTIHGYYPTKILQGRLLVPLPFPHVLPQGHLLFGRIPEKTSPLERNRSLQKSRASSAKSEVSLKDQRVRNKKDSNESKNEKEEVQSKIESSESSSDGEKKKVDGDDNDDGDGVEEKGEELEAERKLPDTDGDKETLTYKVIVKTSDEQGSGTNSEVFIILFGENGDSGKLLLTTPVNEGDIFESGNIDRFILKDVKNVGEIKKIKIGHNNKGAFAGWKLDSVTVKIPSLMKRLHFPCDMWLDDDEGDGKIERELEPEETGMKMSTADLAGKMTKEMTVIPAMMEVRNLKERPQHFIKPTPTPPPLPI
ncbi:putative tetratricopeptide repeat protein 25 isoform X2 [Apostichopus japonicus]|uniref:Outer dynein arm-docking complex subunit 4 n=1 Tax=Stichopus japonicus TaxID=307972 RepID=A0A2G8K737_STIJA|nr:putative tetratricopeptide repeat protein 25 isoform X2 [Apostichopus japonicus]